MTSLYVPTIVVFESAGMSVVMVQEQYRCNRSMVVYMNGLSS